VQGSAKVVQIAHAALSNAMCNGVYIPIAHCTLHSVIKNDDSLDPESTGIKQQKQCTENMK